MSFLRLYHNLPVIFTSPLVAPSHPSLPHTHFLCLPTKPPKLSSSSAILPLRSLLARSKLNTFETPAWDPKGEEDSQGFEYLAQDGLVYQNTLRLVESAMFAAVSGLAYLLSNSLAIENYFGCFFALPIVISSIRWGVAAGRKTMVATAVLLFIISGPVKALNYLLMHGTVGFSMGALWRIKVNWRISIFLCSLARAMGAVGYVLVSSFLIGENILALITINIHASITYILSSMGMQSVPSMDTIYTIFGTLVLCYDL